MKKILLIALLLIFGCSKPVEESTLINKDGLMYLPDSDKPYTGEVFGLYETGENIYDGKYDNGQLVGEYAYYNKNGYKKEPINITTLIDRDSIKYEINSLESFNGEAFDLWNNGNKKLWGYYKNGFKNSKWIFWRENGTKYRDKVFVNGEIKESTYWYENGQMKFSGVYKDGKKDSIWTYKDFNGFSYWGKPTRKYGENGKFILVDNESTSYVSFTNGQKNGSYIKWNNNGQKMEEGKYHFPRFIFGGYDTTLTKSYRIGKWRHFHNNGILKEEGSYSQRASYNLYDSGKPYNIRPSEYKNDWWTYYHDVDVKSAEGKYIRGVKDSLWTYWYTNGQKEREETYKDGKKDSKWTRWHENGQKEWEETYKDGELDGLYTLWDENGSLKFKLTLQDGKMSDTETNNFKFAIQNGVKINSSLIKVFKSVFVIDGKFNCFDGSKSIQEDYVNDRYCDCSDCSDEPLLTR